MLSEHYDNVLTDGHNLKVFRPVLHCLLDKTLLGWEILELFLSLEISL